MIKKLKHIKEFHEIDPYGEENWKEDTKDYLVMAQIENYAGQEDYKIIYVAANVSNQKEAQEKLKNDIGITDEYGLLLFEDITKYRAEEILRRKRRSLRRLNEEEDKLNEEISSLDAYLKDAYV